MDMNTQNDIRERLNVSKFVDNMSMEWSVIRSLSLSKTGGLNNKKDTQRQTKR